MKRPRWMTNPRMARSCGTVSTPYRCVLSSRHRPPSARLRPGAVAQAENVGGKIGEFGLGERNRGHGMLGHHDARGNRACRLTFEVCDLRKARDIGIGVCRLRVAADEMAIREPKPYPASGRVGRLSRQGQPAPKEAAEWRRAPS